MFNIRLANINDSKAIFDLIMQLAEYEKMSEEVVNSPKLIEQIVFLDNAAKVFIAELNQEAIGFALFFETYSTFNGRKGIHLEDFFVKKSYRGNGYGKALFKAVAEYAQSNGYLRLEWNCLDWNEPSQKFYEHMGAQHLDSWWTYRLSGNSLKDVNIK